MCATLGIGEAAARLGITRADLLALQRQDLVPWVSGDALPRFDVDALDAFRPDLDRALRAAHAIERRRPRVPRRGAVR